MYVFFRDSSRLYLQHNPFWRGILEKKCGDLVIYTAFIFFTDSVFIILCPFQLSTFFGLFWLMNHEACPKLIMADHHFVPFFLCLVAIYSKYPFLSWDRLKEQKVMHVAYNISSVVEFQKWWVLKSKLFGQESMCHQEKIFKKILWVMTVCQKVPKSYFQSQFWMSKINRIFSKKKLSKNINLGNHYLLKTFWSRFYIVILGMTFF